MIKKHEFKDRPLHYTVPTRSYKELDKSNCLPGGFLVVRGCNTYAVATGMGFYLFGTRGSGTHNYTHAVKMGKKTYLMTDFEELMNRISLIPLIPY